MTTGSADAAPERYGDGPSIDVTIGCTPVSEGRDGNDALDDADESYIRDDEYSATGLKVFRFNQFIDEALAGLPPTAAVLWLTLFRLEKQGVAWASQGTLAKRLGVDEKTVYRNMKILLDKKLVQIARQGGLGQGSNKYRLGLLPLEPRTNLNRFKKKQSPPKRPAK
jgi:hypothetical protein